ncbi:MAG: DJ-1/PfpI family protein, partial [Patescibacteria group bacterium]
MKYALFIIAPENFQDKELAIPREILEKNGITTTIASTAPGICRGVLGGEVEAAIGLNQINAEDFDAVIFVGGGGSQIFRDDPAALLLAKKAFENEKIVAAICAGPTILAAAGILENKTATVFPDENFQKFLVESGANLSNNPVVVDGKIIT